MHEASLAGGILQLVEDAARRENFRRVSLLRIEVGQLANVELSALQFSLNAIAPGTVLHDARFEYEQPPGEAWCMACSLSVPLPERGSACPHCGGYQLQPTSGTSLRVIDMLVQDD
jgi:hydrogenase nickel incorporation protein HypA/HybF